MRQIACFAKILSELLGRQNKLSLKNLLFLLCLFVVTDAHAATFYFSTSGSNSSGNGSQNSPYYSLCGPWAGAGCTTGNSPISMGQVAVNPGDQLLFKRGDEWVGIDAAWTINATGAPGNPIVFGAWGDPAAPRPVFRGAKTAFELGKDNWTNLNGTSIWYTSGINWWPHVAAQEENAPGGPSLYGAFSVQGVTNANGWTANQSMVRGTFFYESSSQRLYVWRSDNLKPDHAAGRDIYIGVAPTDGTERLVKVNRGYAGTSTDPKFVGQHYRFQDLHVKMSTAIGFSASYPNTEFINCLSELNGMEGFLFDASRFGAPAPGAKGSTMKNSVARRNNLRQGSGIGQGVTIEAENVWAIDSESYENAWAGFDFLDYNAKTRTNGSGLRNCKAHHNGIQPVSQSNYDPNVYIDGGSDITIEGCELWAAGIDPRGVKTRLKPNGGIYVDVEELGFSAGKRPKNIKIINTLSYGNAGTAIRIGAINGRQSAVKSVSNVQVIGSTLHRDRGDSDIKGYHSPADIDYGIRVVEFTGMSGGLVFKNNIVMGYNTVRAPLYGDRNLINLGRTGADFNNNVYHCPGCNFNTSGNFSSGGFFSYPYISNMTLDEWRNLGAAANMRRDDALSKTIVASDPLILNVTPASFSAKLQLISPAIDAADTAAFPSGLAGTTRPDGLADNPYNDLGFHYPLSGPVPPPPAPDTEAPTAPYGLTASVSGARILLSWTASTDNVGVKNYQIFDGSSLFATVTNLSYTFTAEENRNYALTVKALDAANNISAASNGVSIIYSPPDTQAPTAPSGLSAALSGSQVLLTWSASSDNVAVKNYQIFDGSSLFATSSSASHSFTAAEDRAYSLTVKAADAANNISAASNAVSVKYTPSDTQAPTAPSGLVAALTGPQVLLSWNPSTDNVGVKLYQIFDGSSLFAVSTAATHAFTAAEERVYALTVKAVDAANNISPASNAVSVAYTPSDTEAPTVPLNLTAAATASQILLTWSASTDNAGAVSYQIFDGAALLGTSTTASFSWNGVVGQSYSFTVKALDPAGNASAASNTAPLTLTAPPAGGGDPTAPSGLSATLTGFRVDLLWNPPASNPDVYRYRIFNGETMLATVSGTKYAFGALEGRTYVLTVRAMDKDGTLSPASNPATISYMVGEDTEAPSAPSGLAADLSGLQISLSWNAATDNVAVTGYQVFDGSAMLGIVATNSYLMNGTAGQSCAFTVRAMDAANNVSTPSNTATLTVGGQVPSDTSAPTPPSGLAASLSGTQASLTWTASSDDTGVTGYQVFRNGSLIGTTAVLSFTAGGLQAGNSYAFTVKAVDAANNVSAASQAATVTLPAETAPALELSAAKVNNEVRLTWNSVTNAYGYNWFRDDVYKGSVGAPYLTDKQTTPASTYRYAVEAYDFFGKILVKSNAVTVTMDGVANDTVPPSTPIGVTAVSSATQILLSWLPSTDNVGVSLYKIFNGAAQIAASVQNSYAISPVSPNTTYSLTVKACDQAGNCSPSSLPATGISAPQNLAVEIVGSQVLLSWNAVTNASGYNVMRNGIFLKSVNMVSTFDNSAVTGNTYNYTVVAYDLYGVLSVPSNVASISLQGVNLDNEAPSVPEGFTVAPSSTQILLNWAASTDNVGVKEYRIFNGSSRIGTSSATSFTVTPVVQGATYTLTVQACDAAGNCSASSHWGVVSIPDTLPPSIPQNLGGSIGATSLNLSWSASADNVGVAGYQIFDGAVLLGTSTQTSFVLSPVTAGKTYACSVKAYDDANNFSAASSTAAISATDITPPTAPSHLFAAVNGSKVTLTWDASTDAVGVKGYNVYQGTLLAGTTSSLSYTLTGLLSGQKINFRVRAFDAANNLSDQSNTVGVNIDGPAKPSNLVAYVSGNKIAVSWSSAQGAAGYALYRNGTLLQKVNSVSYTDADVAGGKTYRYYVQAYDAGGLYSASSAAMSVTMPAGPSTPTALTGSRVGTRVNLSWKTSTGAYGYNIFRNGSYVGSVSLPFGNDTVLADSAYRYTVQAYNMAGILSSFSNEVTV